MALHNELGKIGEELAMKHLVKLGYKKLDQNYRKKWGEIDIVAQKDKVLHFVEVKTVSHETDFKNYIPEENVRVFKRQRLKRIINTYLAEKHVSYETDFQVDVIAVLYDPRTLLHEIRFLENVIL